ncbi:MAG: 6-carboxytetrahydropterin synthase QueD [Planctomycetes bacterium]|nr:6-carboxytetrahydropterin synthase QueD [Planctomycetota bacterium]
MYELKVSSEFAAAHFLRGYQGKCENVHGHNWKVEVRLRCGKLDKLGMVMDFRKIRALVSEVIERFDHKFLNEMKEFEKINPTTENVSRMIYEEVGPQLPPGITVSQVSCWESDRCAASYFEG